MCWLDITRYWTYFLSFVWVGGFSKWRWIRSKEAGLDRSAPEDDPGDPSIGVQNHGGCSLHTHHTSAILGSTDQASSFFLSGCPNWIRDAFLRLCASKHVAILSPFSTRSRGIRAEVCFHLHVQLGCPRVRLSLPWHPSCQMAPFVPAMFVLLGSVYVSYCLFYFCLFVCHFFVKPCCWSLLFGHVIVSLFAFGLFL